MTVRILEIGERLNERLLKSGVRKIIHRMKAIKMIGASEILHHAAPKLLAIRKRAKMKRLIPKI
jgi:hypothetical protein